MPTSSAPVRVVFLTSIRDVGADDRNGQIVPTDNGPEYMEGVMHRTLVESCSGGSLHGLVQVAGIITDDKQKDLVGTGYRATPDPCEKWIFSIKSLKPTCTLRIRSLAGKRLTAHKGETANDETEKV